MAPTRTSRKADGPAEVDVNSDPNAFISVEPPSGVYRDPALGPCRVTRGAFDAWMSDSGWTEIANSASIEPQPTTTSADDEAVVVAPPAEPS